MVALSRLKTIGIIAVVLVLGFVALGLLSGGEEPDIIDQDDVETPENTDQEEVTEPDEEEEPEPTVNRYDYIPDTQEKMTSEQDNHPPKLHSFLWEDPVIMEGGINTAGAEDSPFISPDDSSFYFFFTPDVQAPVQDQLVDGVTGIWVSRKVDGVWGEAEIVDLTTLGPSLDGCAYVSMEEIWFCSARIGNYKSIDFWKGTLVDERVTDIVNLGEELNTEVIVGELHVSRDGNTIYYHSDLAGGFGGQDVWVVEREGDGGSRGT